MSLLSQVRPHSSCRVRFAATALVIATAIGAILPGALAKKQDFTKQDLSGRDFKGATLDGSDFSGAVLKYADFTKARLRNTTWADADMRNATMDKADFKGADFRNAVLPFRGDNIDFTDANFEGVDMANYRCHDCIFRGADLRNTEHWSQMDDPNFREADLRGADLHTMTDFSPDLSEYTGVIYDDETVWPDFIDPAKIRGAKKK